MEETYWNKFMASGKVDDYLEYKGIQICHSVMERSPFNAGVIG